jgi:uncharacterized cupredoxin-like copper-binding protein
MRVHAFEGALNNRVANITTSTYPFPVRDAERANTPRVRALEPTLMPSRVARGFRIGQIRRDECRVVFNVFWRNGIMERIRGFLFVAIAALAASVFAACGTSDNPAGIAEPTASQSFDKPSTPPASPVQVRLEDGVVRPSRKSVPAGTVTFHVLNKGTHEHEFVVVKTDLAIADLPTNPDGSFDEEGDGVEVIDEIEDIEPGGQATLSVDLAAGHYVLLCNKVIVLDNGEVISHFAMGMSTDFTVTAARH